MQCPTCGKRIQKNQSVCPYCGALVRSTPLAPLEKKTTPGVEPEATKERWLIAEEKVEQEETLEELEEMPSVPSPQPSSQSPHPRPPSLFRFLLPLLFLLIPLLNILWNSSLRPWSRQTPVLRQALLCEEIRNGRPLNPKEVFSLREDRQAVLYALWSGGARERHSYSLRWHLPDGKVQPVSTTVARYRPGREEFYAYAILLLRPGMSLGKWRVEIVLDQSVQAQLSFELRE